MWNPTSSIEQCGDAELIHIFMDLIHNPDEAGPVGYTIYRELALITGWDVSVAVT